MHDSRSIIIIIIIIINDVTSFKKRERDYQYLGLFILFWEGGDPNEKFDQALSQGIKSNY